LGFLQRPWREGISKITASPVFGAGACAQGRLVMFSVDIDVNMLVVVVVVDVVVKLVYMTTQVYNWKDIVRLVVSVGDRPSGFRC
jgi:hypothetical protein